MTFRCLVSYHYHRDSDLASIAAAYGGRVRIFADSGAYSAHTLGSQIKMADYVAWLRHWGPLITTMATLDVIGDPEATEVNTQRMWSMGLDVLPTFHAGSPWPVLERMVRDADYVALGGLVPWNKQPDLVKRWLVRCFKIGAEHGAVFHGYGLTRVKTLADLPFYSVDSSYWTAGVMHGRLTAWDDRARRLTEIKIGRRRPDAERYRLVRSHGADPRMVLAPGFCVRTERDQDTYLAERATACGICALAHYRMGQWLIDRHQVTPPPGQPGPGTALYLADAAIRNIISAAQWIAAHDGKAATHG